MRIVKPSATLLSVTPDAEQLIERCGRVCYKSEDKITPDSAAKFIGMVMARGHHSVIEHAYATVLFVCDRGVTHELVRHRLVAYSQESTRYCNYSKEKFGRQISVIRPPDLGDSTELWQALCEHIETTYLAMLDAGASPQIARSILPNCLKTEIATTANLREWRHILTLRTNKAAHPQIREVMTQAAKLLVAACPTVFSDFAIQEARRGEEN